MKRLFFMLVLLLASAYLLWPYAVLYQIDQALLKNQRAEFEQWVDLAQITSNVKQQHEDLIQRNLGQTNVVSQLFRQGANTISNFSIDQIDLLWVKNAIIRRDLSVDNRPISLFDQVDFAFFESPQRFLVRVGKLGKQPVHFIMQLEESQWRIVAIYQ